MLTKQYIVPDTDEHTHTATYPDDTNNTKICISLPPYTTSGVGMPDVSIYHATHSTGNRGFYFNFNSIIYIYVYIYIDFYYSR